MPSITATQTAATKECPQLAAATHVALSSVRASSSRLSAMSASDLWRSSTPAELRSAWRDSPDTAGWIALQAELEHVAIGKTDEQTFVDALLWGVGEPLQAFANWRDATLRLLSRKAKGKKKTKKRKSSIDASLELTARIDAWCEGAENAQPTVSFALECLTWAYALPAVAASVSGETWWRLAEQLDATATLITGARPGDEAGGADLMIDQLLGGELPLVLSAVLPDAKPWRALGKRASETLTDGVLAWTDGEGLPPGRGIECLGLVAACWTRCRRLSLEVQVKCWDSAAQTQYEWFVRQLVRFVGRRGRLLLNGDADFSDLVKAAIDCAGDASDRAAAVLRLGAKAGSAGKQAAEPAPSVNSEWSGVSLLASGWGKKSPRLLATYDEMESRLALDNQGEPVLAGTWRTSITRGGAPVAFDGAWEEVCWFSDDDCDYLEYAVDLEGGGKLERMVLLAKEDSAAMLVDLVHTNKKEAVTLEVETRLSLAAGVRFKPTAETREGWLVDDRRQLVGVIPPAMAEWRVDPRGGELTSDANGSASGDLVLTHEAVGTAIACPVWFDLKPKRFAKQRTWRQLTVAESLEPVGRDVAVGYRVQSGKDQWLLYRSLARKANRTVMGQNYSSESFFGRFDPKTGLAEEYFEVEA